MTEIKKKLNYRKSKRREGKCRYCHKSYWDPIVGGLFCQNGFSVQYNYTCDENMTNIIALESDLD